MQDKSRNNFISIAKAIGIILMVVGHSGCPAIINSFLYIFHMPLFFVCSGYFFKEIIDQKTLIVFCKKKIKKLYFPYLSWSIIFLLLHNLFFNIGISPVAPYCSNDYINHFVKMVFMVEFELLIRPFWFLKELIISSIMVATISLLRNSYFKWISNDFVFVIIFFLTILCKFETIKLPFLGDISIITFSCTYIYSGILFRKYEHCIPLNLSTTSIMFAITLIGSALFVGTIDMRYTTIFNIIPYFALSIFGILTTFYISKQLNSISYFKTCLHYIGNHTMPIFVLNLISLKIGSLIKVWIYKMPTEAMSSHPIIYEYNDYYWIFYTIIGITIPLFIEATYQHLIKKLKNVI